MMPFTGSRHCETIMRRQRYPGNHPKPTVAAHPGARKFAKTHDCLNRQNCNSKGRNMNRLLLALILALAVITLRAQTASGVIEGVVKDDSGALVVGARVKLTDESTNQSREQLTTP